MQIIMRRGSKHASVTTKIFEPTLREVLLIFNAVVFIFMQAGLKAETIQLKILGLKFK
jgi:hypothetical protein